MIKLLNELDEKRITTCNFQSFKNGFQVPFSYDPQRLPLLGEVRNYLEGVMILNYETVKDAAKKHTWLCQKIHDVLRVNSLLLKKQELERKIKADKEASEEPLTSEEKEVISNFIDKAKLTASDKSDIEDTTGERRFNEVTL